MWFSGSVRVAVLLFWTLKLLVDQSSAEDLGHQLSFKKVVYSEQSQRQDKAYQQCSSRPQVKPAFGHSAIRAGATKHSETVDKRGRRGLRSGRQSNSALNLVLLPTQRGHLVDPGGLGFVKDTLEERWLPDEEFTLDVWVHPDGGQRNPAVLLVAGDICSPFEGEGFQLGVASHGEREPHFYAKIQTAESGQESSLVSPLGYLSNSWVHVALVYDGEVSLLFVNGARVARAAAQKGKLFHRLHSSDSATSCRYLELGGGFRGLVALTRLWRKALSPEEVRAVTRLGSGTRHQNAIPHASSVVLWDNYDGDVRWDWSLGTSSPETVSSTFNRRPFDTMPVVPPCGFTLCDSPEVIGSYTANWELRTPKTIRYNVINVKNDDGTNETVNQSQIDSQHQGLLRAFQPFNISWEYRDVSVRDTSLRKKTVLIGCKPQLMGNGICDAKCAELTNTNNDGGDCDKRHRQCKIMKLGANGRCDKHCNIKYYNWDKGDCCDPRLTDTSVTCLDPSSPNRAYLSLEEYKNIISVPSDRGINVYFAHWTDKDIVGLATFPWEKEASTELGGILIRPEDFGVQGQMDTLVHELGHALGLWHVHRGVSEMDCDHLCFESTASMTNGDLCSDTEPTMAHSGCRDPERSVCGAGPFKNTPFNNYMSYADDNCTDSFSAQQAARMHCYLDSAYPGWQLTTDDTLPPPPPLPPVVTSSASGKVNLAWTPPLNQDLYLEKMDVDCSGCTEDGAHSQYGWKATGFKETPGEFWARREATGAPDSESCYPSVNSWMSDQDDCHAMSNDMEPIPENPCYLSVSFKTPVVPSSVSIWLNYNARQGLKNVLLVFADGTNASLGAASGTCDEPFTVVPSRVLPWLEKERKEVKGIVLLPSNPFVGVDAVRIISFPHHSSCSKCEPVHYRLHRSPPWPNQRHHVDIADTELEDASVQEGVTYAYRVSAFTAHKHSLPSPPIAFVPGRNVCGDGLLDETREGCDDGNLVNGDGCARTCQIERGFFCTGLTSVCYWHQGDGVCEKSELELVVEDCGYHTPPGFLDQWAERIETFPGLNSPICPVNSMAGPPKTLRCNSDAHNASLAWQPCPDYGADVFQFDAYFQDAVVAAAISLYLESDGRLSYRSEGEGFQMLYQRELDRKEFGPAEATVDLISQDGTLIPLGVMVLSCTKNPVTLPIRHDLTRPFVLTKGLRIRFASPEVSFAAIGLRALGSVSPVAVGPCYQEESSSNLLYSPLLGRCVGYEVCDWSLCKEPLVKNGKLECSGFREGNVCTLVCDPGYYLVGVQPARQGAKVTCRDGHWVGDILTCRPVDCHPPRIPHADAFCPEGTTFGRNCTFKCRPPARLRTVANGASSTSAVVTCTVRGLWSEAEPLCHLSCPTPAAPENALLTDENCERLKIFSHGQRCQFRCGVGYHVQEVAPKRQFFHLRCDVSGIWSGPICVPVNCSPPDGRDGGVLKCPDGNRLGDVCFYECPNAKSKRLKDSTKAKNDGLSMRASCESDGKWRPPFKPCPITTSHCPSPVVDAAVKVDCGENLELWAVGHVCRLFCSRPDEELFLPSLSIPKWSLSREALTIQCTGQGTWFPLAESILCDSKCNQDYVSDGFCDAINNRQVCGWDGGDCCEATLKEPGQKVKPIPATCGEKCRCLNPAAMASEQP